MSKRRKNWFAVKSLYRTVVTEPPKVTDADYDPASDLIEERVVLIRARTADKALRLARREANRYAKEDVRTNPYGQQVVTRRLEILESCWLSDSPGDRREIWSSMSRMPSELTDAQLITMRFGPDEGDESLRLRKKFLNGLFSRMDLPRDQA